MPSLSPWGRLQLCPAVLQATAQGSLGVSWEAGGLPSCRFDCTDTMKAKAAVGIYLYPLLSPGAEKPETANGQCVSDQGGCQRDLWKSDFLFHFCAGEKVTTSPFSIVSLTLFPGCSRAGKWTAGREGARTPASLSRGPRGDV